jgi:uncharacterized protein YciI
MKIIISIAFISLSFLSNTFGQVIIDDEGFQTFEMTEGDTTFIMKQYYFGLIKRGPITNQPDSLLSQLQTAHLSYMDSLANKNKLHIAGPFGHDGEHRGIVVYNTPTFEEARLLANGDPMVKIGRLIIEVYPWWAAKGSTLK